jgi:hypothetical protein
LIFGLMVERLALGKRPTFRFQGQKSTKNVAFANRFWPVRNSAAPKPQKNPAPRAGGRAKTLVYLTDYGLVMLEHLKNVCSTLGPMQNNNRC